MARQPRTRTRLRDQRGFTLIELLVVIMILGVLGAIAIPTFLDQRAKAEGASGKSDARMARTALETFHVDNQTYNATAADLIAIEPRLSGTNGLAVAGGPRSYTLSVQTVKGTMFGFELYETGAVRRFCLPAGEGGCPKSGSW